MEKLREVNLATRRIGLGVMGWADALVRLGIPYDSERALELASEVAGFIHDTAWEQSQALAVERGPFSEYENSALKARGMPPVRNSSVTTIAPTGTISRIADCSSGIEPHFANAWWSNVLWAGGESDSKATARLLDAPTSIREALVERLGDEEQAREALAKIANNPDEAEQVFNEYGIDPASFRTSMSITPEAHIRMQAAWQRYITNSVSKTINLPNSATVEDIDAAYRLAWETKCKAVTVYRDGSKSMQVLETGQQDEEQEEQTIEVATPSALFPDIDPTGSWESMESITRRVRIASGWMYVTIVFHPKTEKPFEVFADIGKAGGSEPAHMEGLTKMITMNLQAGFPVNAICSNLRGITSEPMTHDGMTTLSPVDGIAQVLAMHGEGPFSPLAQPSAEPIFMPLNGITEFQPIESAAVAIAAPTTGFNGAVGCPKCGGRLVMQEGCATCLDCGHSKCD